MVGRGGRAEGAMDGDRVLGAVVGARGGDGDGGAITDGRGSFFDVPRC